MLHLQADVNNWTETLPRLPDRALVKATTNGQRFREVKAVNPNIKTCLRHVRDDLQVYQPGHAINLNAGWFNWEAAKDGARTWFDTFIDTTFRNDIAPFCDAVSWHNEIWANSQNNLERDERVDAAIAATHIWNSEYRNTFSNDIKLVIGEAAVGNWMPREIAALSIAEDGWLGYHPYDYWNRKQRADEGLVAALSMLWDAMELDWGLKPTWIFTEAGPFESALTGWRSPECLGGDRDLYVSAVRQWMQDVSQTPAYREGRIVGFALFTSGGGDQWKGFETSQPELNMLADMIAQEWQPGTAPPPPPPPPDNDDVPYVVVVNLIPQDVTDEEYDYTRDQTKQAKETILQSADDAARLVAPGRPGSKVKVWAPSRWTDDIVQWLIDRGVNIVKRFEFLAILAPLFIWPVGNDWHLTSGGDGGLFDAPRSAYPGNHEGIDLLAAYNDPIYAAMDGLVVWASNRRRSDGAISLYGNHIVIDHENGYITWSAHLESMTVQVGDIVMQGDTIGRAGSTGNSTGTHLHFAVQHIGHGLSGYVIPDVIDPSGLLGV